MTRPIRAFAEWAAANAGASRTDMQTAFPNYNPNTIAAQYVRTGLNTGASRTSRRATGHARTPVAMFDAMDIDSVSLDMFTHGADIVATGADILAHETDGEMFQCSFEVRLASALPGIYAWYINGVLVYIGRTGQTLYRRLNSNYGRMSQSRMGANGPRHDVRLNARIAEHLGNGDHVRVEWLATPDHVRFETLLIARHQPAWNVIGINRC